LFEILNNVIKDGEETTIKNLEYLDVFKIEDEATVQQIWNTIYDFVKLNIHPQYRKTLEIILKQGSLSSRILRAIDGNFEPKNIVEVYQNLADCLKKNTLFIP